MAPVTPPLVILTETQSHPMILVLLTVMVQCIRGAEGALTVHMSREDTINFVNDEIKTVQKKTYRHDIEVEWDGDVFERAVKMLGDRLQGKVNAESVEKILQMMDYLSTGTEKEGRIEWSRETFDMAVKELGERHQCKVTAREMEEILYAMDYMRTGRVDMVHVSEYMEVVTEWSKESAAMMWDRKIFERAYNILADKEQYIVGAHDTVEILHLMEYLSIRKEWEYACYSKLAKKALEDHKRGGEEIAMRNRKRLRRRMLREGRKIRSFELYMQHVLRLSASECGMRLIVDEKNKTLDLRSSSRKKERKWSTSRTKKWVLRIEVNDRYRSHTKVQSIVAVVIEMMVIAVEMDMEMLKREDRGMLERIMSSAQETKLCINYYNIEDIEMLKSIIFRARKTKLSIKYIHIKRGAIAEQMERLKDDLVGLNVSWNKNLSNEDWETIGRITRLEKLDISFCDIPAEAIGQCMKKLNLVELNVSWNDNLSIEDWKAVGRMTKLERLNVWDCGIPAEAIGQCMKELDLVELYVSGNKNLSNGDWKVIGGMTRLSRLHMSFCDIPAGTISRCMAALGLVELCVSGNTNLSTEDWETIGKMKKLERLHMSFCDIPAGTIARYMQELNLVELGVLGNTNLSDSDWETIGSMSMLEKLDIRGYYIQEEQISTYLGRLKCRIIK